MQYTILGKRTGLKVSALGFGAMRLPMKGSQVDLDRSTPLIHRAFDLGINYIDTAVGYCNGDSQRAVGEALRGRRDKIVVSTKNHSWGRKDERDFHKNLEESLRKLDIQQIDIYHIHGLNWQGFQEQVDGKGGSYEWMARAKEQGLVRHICFSFHDTPEALEKIARTGMFDIVTCQYNLLDRANEKAIALCRKLGLGVVAMGPVAGGRLGAPSQALQKLVPGSASVPETALRFVMANPAVSVALSGMSSIDMVEENARVAARKTALTTSESAAVKRTLAKYKKLADLYCTGCNYCMPCPSGVDIPRNFGFLQQTDVYGLKDEARSGYASSGNKASQCIACGKCMPKCPQHIDIIGQLRKVVARLDDSYGSLAVQLHPGKLDNVSRNGKSIELHLRSVLTLTNLSDQPAEAAVSFAPAKGLAISPATSRAQVGSFARRQIPVQIAASYRPGKVIQTPLAVETSSQLAIGQTSFNIAVAASGGSAALAKAVAVPAVQPDSERKVTPSVAAKHALKFATAYDDQALYLRATIKDDLAYPPARGELWSYDRIELELDMGALAGGQGQQSARSRHKIFIGMPDAQNRCRVFFADGGNSDTVTVEPRKTGGGVSLAIRLPWETLGCKKIRPGDAFGLKLLHVSYAKNGQENYRRHWDTSGGWVLLE